MNDPLLRLPNFMNHKYESTPITREISLKAIEKW